jgi:hypothetical protein
MQNVVMRQPVVAPFRAIRETDRATQQVSFFVAVALFALAAALIAAAAAFPAFFVSSFSLLGPGMP